MANVSKATEDNNNGPAILQSNTSSLPIPSKFRIDSSIFLPSISARITLIKLMLACAVFWHALLMYHDDIESDDNSSIALPDLAAKLDQQTFANGDLSRRLEESVVEVTDKFGGKEFDDSRRSYHLEETTTGGSTADKKDEFLPSYTKHLEKDLQDRKKLFRNTPPEEFKYWFEYTGELQKYTYRFSKNRGKAEYFEGRDDSGVTSARFFPEPGSGQEYEDFFLKKVNFPENELSSHFRLLENCLSMGHPVRPIARKGIVRNDRSRGRKNTSDAKGSKGFDRSDRCRILFTISTIGMERLWKTVPPQKKHMEQLWQPEHLSLGTHLQRNLMEIDLMCESGQITATVNILACEPIVAQWKEWMQSKLVNCMDGLSETEGNTNDRPTPLHVVVVADTPNTNTCLSPKSGFIEKRMQDLTLAPPHPHGSNMETKKLDPDTHDLFVTMKWSTLVTIRSVNSFLQASADIGVATMSPEYPKFEKPRTGTPESILQQKGSTEYDSAENESPDPFLIPSFVRVSYVSQDSPPLAKWRMHGDFFHPAAWEICSDSYETVWVPHSLSGHAGRGICFKNEVDDVVRGNSTTFLEKSTTSFSTSNKDCGQWWIFLKESQMPSSHEIYANEETEPVVDGGSNSFWMATERQRRKIAEGMACRKNTKNKENGGEDLNNRAAPVFPAGKSCVAKPKAVIPLGDMESFLANHILNNSLGKKHRLGKYPGYSMINKRNEEKRIVKMNKNLRKDQQEIDKALFEHAVYPVALFRKDATVAAAKTRNEVFIKNSIPINGKLQAVKSSYYDFTIAKPRPPVLGWCQAIARRGLCTLYADYFRLFQADDVCAEACGMKKNWSKIR